MSSLYHILLNGIHINTDNGEIIYFASERFEGGIIIAKIAYNRLQNGTKKTVTEFYNKNEKIFKRVEKVTDKDDRIIRSTKELFTKQGTVLARVKEVVDEGSKVVESIGEVFNKKGKLFARRIFKLPGEEYRDSLLHVPHSEKRPMPSFPNKKSSLHESAKFLQTYPHSKKEIADNLVRAGVLEVDEYTDSADRKVYEYKKGGG